VYTHIHNVAVYTVSLSYHVCMCSQALGQRACNPCTRRATVCSEYIIQLHGLSHMVWIYKPIFRLGGYW